MGDFDDDFRDFRARYAGEVLLDGISLTRALHTTCRRAFACGHMPRYR